MSNLALDLARCLDPTLLLIDAGIEADAWQWEFLHSTAQQLLMLCSRQSGKSTVLGALGLHTSLYMSHSLVLMIAPGQRQSGELFRKLLSLYRTLRQPIDPEQENQQRLELVNR